MVVLVVAGGIVIFKKFATPRELTTLSLTEAQALAIAEKTCIKGGESLAPGYYNENSKTWWFDANLNSTKPGCNPACVVSAETRTAEINWRCTGLILENPEILNIFRKKYPQYKETLTITINQQSDGHARGSVSFVEGEPGGIFLAATVSGKWQIVHEGNGQISCDLSKYGFPREMIADCAK